MPAPPSHTPAPSVTKTLLTALRATITGASRDYVGSVTLSSTTCDRLRLAHRQLVQLRVERTGVEIWTYVIRTTGISPDTVCVNGAAACLVLCGDVVLLTAYGNCDARMTPRVLDAVRDGFEALEAPLTHVPGDEAVVDVAVGKIHRPRVTAVRATGAAGCVPCVRVDGAWMEEAGFAEGQQVHVANVRSGRRDVVVVLPAMRGGRDCELCGFGGDEGDVGVRGGCAVGDVVIVMAYCEVRRGVLFGEGFVPEMKVCFPEETPEGVREECWRVMEGGAPVVVDSSD